MNAFHKVPVHVITGRDDPSVQYPNTWIPKWLFDLPLDYPATHLVMHYLSRAWWRGLEWGVAIGICCATVLWWAI